MYSCTLSTMPQGVHKCHKYDQATCSTSFPVFFAHLIETSASYFVFIFPQTIPLCFSFYGNNIYIENISYLAKVFFTHKQNGEYVLIQFRVYLDDFQVAQTVIF